MHEVLIKRLVKIPQEKVNLGEMPVSTWPQLLTGT